jgi:hypothetical protein
MHVLAFQEWLSIASRLLHYTCGRSTQRGSDMRNRWRAERERLANLLKNYESGSVTHLDDNSRGEFGRETTAGRISTLKERIAYLDEKLESEPRH